MLAVSSTTGLPPFYLVSLAAGAFTGDGRTDLVVVDRGTHTIIVLKNDGHSGFLDSTGVEVVGQDRGLLQLLSGGGDAVSSLGESEHKQLSP